MMPHVRQLLLGLALAGCDQSGTSPLGVPLDDLAGFSGVPVMQPGADCMQCHRSGGNGAERVWTAAGTVFPRPDACPLDGGPGCLTGVQGVQVLLTDANGQQLTLTTNSAGNFYTDQPLATLTSIMIQNGKHRMVMNLGVFPDGGVDLVSNQVAYPADGGVSCNACHTAANGPPILGLYGAPGNLFVPEN